MSKKTNKVTKKNILAIFNFEKLLPYLLTIVLIVIDQMIKWWVLKQSLFMQLNKGFIFGLGEHWDLFFWISCIIIVGLFIFTIQKPRMQTYNLLLILAAALGNLIDRIFRGGVVDYWKMNYFGVQIYFNLADILLIIGVFLYAWQVGKENNN